VKKELGQFYTKNAKYITQDLLDIFQDKQIVIDPFAGEWDLIKLINNPTIAFDIEPKNKLTIQQDTLLNPPNYKNSWVFTNPPYLARNRTKNKDIFNIYKVDDLYKAAIISLLECEGGVLIVPLNFFSEESNAIRKIFFDRFKIIKVNVFEEQVFEDTTYTICAFSFIKGKTDTIHFTFYPNKEIREIDFSNYSIDLDLKDSKIDFYRFTSGECNTKIFLQGLDKRKEKISFELKEPYKGKISDRMSASFCCSKELSKTQQKNIITIANHKLNFLREEYKSLFLSNYRDFGRKRISFNLAIKFLNDATYWALDE
jgi:hypothetical protein